MIPENVVTTQHGPLSEELLNSPNQDGPKTPMKGGNLTNDLGKYSIANQFILQIAKHQS